MKKLFAILFFSFLTLNVFSMKPARFSLEIPPDAPCVTPIARRSPEQGMIESLNTIYNYAEDLFQQGAYFFALHKISGLFILVEQISPQVNRHDEIYGFIREVVHALNQLSDEQKTHLARADALRIVGEEGGSVEVMYQQILSTYSTHFSFCSKAGKRLADSVDGQRKRRR